jgi:hypothetical protein
MEHMNLRVCSGLVYLCILLSCEQLVSHCDSQAACFGKIVNQDNYNKSLVFVIKEACFGEIQCFSAPLIALLRSSPPSG